MSKNIFSFIKKLAEYYKENKQHSEAEPDVLFSLIIDYENALTAFGITITENCRSSMIAAIKENAHELLDTSGSNLLHFASNSEAEVMGIILSNIVKYDMLDRESVLAFEKRVFSLKYLLGGEKVPYGIDLSAVLVAFSRNERNRSIIIEAKRLHSLEIASLATRCSCEDTISFLKHVSDSFQSLTEIYRDDPRYLNIAWIKYINFVSDFAQQLPEALLAYVSAENYRMLFDTLQKYMSKRNRRNGIRQQANMQELAVAVCEKILREIDGADVPAKLFLGKIYESRNQFEKARIYYADMLTTNSFFSGVTSTINACEKEIRYLLDAKYRNLPEVSALSQRIPKINEYLEDFYEHWESDLLWRINTCQSDEKDKLTDQYVTLVTKHARHEKDRREYRLAYEMLLRLSDNVAESFRIPLELGLLYQTRGSNSRQNEYHDSHKAIAKFSEALTLLESKGSGDVTHAQKSILIPMANTYFSMGDWDKALDICERVLRLDPYEKNAMKLKKAVRISRCA